MSRFRSALGLVSLLAASGLACGGDEGDVGDSGHGAKDAAVSQDTAGGGSDTADAPDEGGGGDAVETLALEPFQVSHLGGTMALKGGVFKPTVCQTAAPCPLVVVVGDRDQGAWPTYESAASQLAAAVPAVVVVFNLPGTGPGSMKSTGDNDFGGDAHVAAVKEVMKVVSSRKYIWKDPKDPNNIKAGFLAVGYGLVPTARAMQQFGLSTLKFVRFLIDVEGPVDRCAASESPEDVGKGIGPEDGPGVTDTACHFSAESPHSAMYPPAKNGKPSSIVCSVSAWPITETGEDCTKTSWWSVREPYGPLKQLALRYQRVQFVHDHRLPSYWASRHAVAAVASSKSRFFVINDIPPCNAPPDDAWCQANGCWLQGPWGNGLAPAPYAAGQLAAIPLDALFGDVLPRFVVRMLDEVKYPNCR